MDSQTIKTILLLTLLINLLVLSGCYRHENRHHSHHHRFGFSNHANEIARVLELNEDQEKQLDELLSTFEEKRDEIKNGHILVDDVVQQLTKEQFDEAYVKSAISNYLGEVEESSLDFATQLSAFHRKLTVDQRASLAKHLTSSGKWTHVHK